MAGRQEQIASPGIEWILVVGGLLMIVGSFLPWWHAEVVATTVDRNGMQLGTDLSFSWNGIWTILVGALVTLIGITRLTRTPFPRWLTPSPLIAGAIGLFDGISSYQSINTAIHGQQAKYSLGSLSNFSIGYGLWLVIVGAAITFLFSLLAWNAMNKSVPFWRRRL